MQIVQRERTRSGVCSREDVPRLFLACFVIYSTIFFCYMAFSVVGFWLTVPHFLYSTYCACAPISRGNVLEYEYYEYYEYCSTNGLAE